jgi:hypothetical protein
MKIRNKHSMHMLGTRLNDGNGDDEKLSQKMPIFEDKSITLCDFKAKEEDTYFKGESRGK